MIGIGAKRTAGEALWQILRSPVLLLFDIDGTLVRTRPLTHQTALNEARVEVFGLRVAPGESPVSDVEPWGKTDRQILRDALTHAGLEAPAPDAVGRWEQAACAAYEELEVHDAAMDHAPIAAALDRLRAAGHNLALVTGGGASLLRHCSPRGRAPPWRRYPRSRRC
jgi:phosphoglycolate phosphatase-like HAD superfamily hydrolase